MFEPFIWMFNTENFKKRCFQLSITIIITLVLTIIVSIANGVFFSTNYLVFHILLGITILLPVLLILLLQGYFWELTANIISRELDIQASNIYSGKIKQIFKIQLPEFNPIKFIWRGFASVIASVLMFIPFILLVISTAYTSIFILPFENIDFYHKMYAISYNIIYFLFFAMIPALLWNYAKQNSIVAVWDFRKATYLLENYPKKYFINTLIFIIFYISNSAILAGLSFVYGIQKFTLNFSLNSFIGFPILAITTILFIFTTYIIYLYSLHVYAYLLGTIAPTTEY